VEAVIKCAAFKKNPLEDLMGELYTSFVLRHLLEDAGLIEKDTTPNGQGIKLGS